MKNNELEMVPIGREAFVFIVNIKNKVDNLSDEQIREIYEGKRDEDSYPNSLW